MQKEVWVDCSRNKKLIDVALQYESTGILGKSKRVKNLPKNFRVYEISSQADIESLAKYCNKVSHIGIKLTDWKVIPIENLIAIFQGSNTKLIVKTDNLREIELYNKILEVGVDGVLVDREDTIKAACLIYKPSSKIKLIDAKVDMIKKVNLGKRVCVDCIMSFEPCEGLLVGARTNGYFVAIAEIKENPYVNPREWRVNAGAAALYTKARTKDGLITSKYLDDLVSGDEVIVVNSRGITRTETVLRIKKEFRPMIYIDAMHKGKKISTCSQNAETVSLLTNSGAKPVTEIKEGDIVKVNIIEPLATHFGRPVKERIIEG